MTPCHSLRTSMMMITMVEKNEMKRMEKEKMKMMEQNKMTMMKMNNCVAMMKRNKMTMMEKNNNYDDDGEKKITKNEEIVIAYLIT